MTDGFLVAVAGSISHHEDVTRLRKVYQLVQDARQQIVGGFSSFFCWRPDPSQHGFLEADDLTHASVLTIAKCVFGKGWILAGQKSERISAC